MLWLGATFKDHLVQPPSCGQGHFPLDQGFAEIKLTPMVNTSCCCVSINRALRVDVGMSVIVLHHKTSHSQPLCAPQCKAELLQPCVLSGKKSVLQRTTELLANTATQSMLV